MVDNTVRLRMVSRMTAMVVCTASCILVAPALSAQTLLAQTVATEAPARSATPLSSRALTLVTVNAAKLSLKTVLQHIAQQAGLTPFYGAAVAQSSARVTLHVRNVPAADAFDKALQGTGLVASFVDDKVVFKDDPAGAAIVQGSVSGKVVDEKTRVPLRGATITLDGATRGVITGDDGVFRFPVVTPGAHTVAARMLGYVKTTKSVTVTEGQTATVDFALEASVNALDQVIVTGTVVATEQRAIPNALTVITGEELQQRGITHVDQLFRGDVPGLYVMNQGSRAQFDSVVMFSRGATRFQADQTVAASNPIKTFVDGVEISNPAYLSQIDPRSIERIEILSGPQASTIYGSNAIDGVMQIFTKRGSGSARPQLTATLLSGFIENNYTTALAPQHDFSAQINGTESRISYNAGGTWVYVSPWSPTMQTQQLSGYGGMRLDIPVGAGNVTTDASIRINQSKNHAFGALSPVLIQLRNIGRAAPTASSGRGEGVWDRQMDSRTLGLTLKYAPTSWWSHEMVIGNDVLDRVNYMSEPMYTSAVSDTIRRYQTLHTDRSSLRYSTTAQVPVASFASAVLTLGVDRWSGLFQQMNTMTNIGGTFMGSPYINRLPNHNTGAFFQGQFGVWDALFLTYGLRAEWNPNYGEEAQPNWAPRYGAAYSRDVGPITAKLRASYGRTTRPPTETQKVATPQTNATSLNTYGPYDTRFASDELGPESQQGWEGGLELYYGARASLVVTRYNQTVDNLIAAPTVDSVRSLEPNSSGAYTYAYQSQSLNIGSVRNQGWELQGNTNVGPLSVRGTYAWTKSRVIGITQKYRSLLTSQYYQPGFTYSFLPEHTWGLRFTYNQAASMVSLNFNGIGKTFRYQDENSAYWGSWNRFDMTKDRMGTPLNYRSLGDAYIMTDLSASRRFSPRIEGVLQVQNLTDFYQNDYSAGPAAMGRQSKFGLRLRF